LPQYQIEGTAKFRLSFMMDFAERPKDRSLRTKIHNTSEIRGQVKGYGSFLYLLPVFSTFRKREKPGSVCTSGACLAAKRKAL